MHGVSFELAQTAFEDTFAIDRVDDRKDCGEERFVLSGKAKNGFLLYIAYTEREDHVRIISARKVTSQERYKYYEQMPEVVEAMTPEALADPDAQPLTADDFARMKRVPQIKVIRRALDLTQEEFSLRFHIPLGTLRDWEQGRAEPDQPTRAYLKLIARDPDHVNRTLNAKAS